MDSIHIPASAVQRALRIAGGVVLWLIPSSGVALALALKGAHWLGLETSESVADLLAPLRLDVARIGAQAMHADDLAKAHDPALSEAWAEVVALHAELEVYRRYGDKDIRRRNELIEDATSFYRDAYDAELREHAGSPAKAAAAALRARWRP